MSPFRAARSSSTTASVFTSGVASVATAFLSAVRSAERWARLRMAAARDFRMFFFAEAIFGTKSLQTLDVCLRCGELDWNTKTTSARAVMSRRHTTLTRVDASTTLRADAPTTAHPDPSRRLGSKHADEHPAHHSGASLRARRARVGTCLLYTSPSPRDGLLSR